MQMLAYYVADVNSEGAQYKISMAYQGVSCLIKQGNVLFGVPAISFTLPSVIVIEGVAVLHCARLSERRPA